MKRFSEMSGKEKASLATAVFFLAFLLTPTLFMAVSAGRITYKTCRRQYEDTPENTARHFLYKFRLSGKKAPVKSRALQKDERFLFEGRGGWDYALNDLYGGIQRLLGKRFVTGFESGRYLLTNGTLVNHLNRMDEAQIERLAEPAAELREKLAERGIPFLYLLPLYAICARDPLLPYGAEDATNENEDLLARKLGEKNIPVIDPRAELHRAGEDHHAFAFKTDHHTRPEAGRLIARALALYLRDHAGFAADPELFAPEAYETRIYEKLLRGTFYSSYGPLYLRPDDFSLIVPKFETSFTVEARTKAGTQIRNGRFEETLLDLSRLDMPDSDLPLLYTGYNYGFHRAVNHRAPNDKKILLIHDSYSCAVIPFLALACRELVSLDLRPLFRTVGPLDEVLEREKPDAVILETGFMGTDLR